ncbi:MAG: hypothetical protein CMQ41_07870 [Gammaproteobacteria bacterium]|nr:hypothetical protein [Gammaproteobacteria bacterium]|tara:strand:+ start:717 stop:1007 length:291 start_codon:yes stop_codon:yes gene_type:complete
MDNEVKNDLQTYYLLGEPVVDIIRKEGKLVVEKWYSTWYELIIFMPNEQSLFTHMGEEWHGIQTVSDLKILVYGEDTFTVSDEMAEAIRNYKGESK